MELSLKKILTILCTLAEVNIFVFGQESELAKINKYLDELPSVEIDINEVIRNKNRDFFKKRGVDIDAVHANLKKLKDKSSLASNNNNEAVTLSNVAKTKTEKKDHSQKKDGRNYKSSHNARRQTIAATKAATNSKQTTKFIFNEMNEEYKDEIGSLQEIEGQFKAAHGEFEHAGPEVHKGMALDPDLRSLQKPRQQKRQQSQAQGWNGNLKQNKGAVSWVLSENDTFVIKYANNKTRSVHIDNFRSVLYPKNTRTLYPTTAVNSKLDGSLRKTGFEGDFEVPDLPDPGGPHGFEFDQEAGAAKGLRAGFDNQYLTGINGMNGRGPMAMDQGGQNWMGQMGMGPRGPNSMGSGSAGGGGPMGMGPGGFGPNGQMDMGPYGPMGMDPGGPMGMGPNALMGMGPNGQMGMGPNAPMGMGPGGVMGMGPNGPMGMDPNGQIGMGPNGPMGMDPNGQLGMGLNGPMGMGPNGPMSMGRDGPMGMGPNGPISMGPTSQMGMDPNVQIGMGPNGPMGMDPNGPMGMGPNGPMSMGPNVPIGMGPGGLMGVSQVGAGGAMGMGPPNGQMGMGPDYPMGIGPNAPKGVGPGGTMGMGPNGPMGMGQGGPVGLDSFSGSGLMVTGPGGVNVNGQMGMGPGSPMGMGPGGPSGIGSGIAMGMSPDGQMGMGPNSFMGLEHGGPMGMGPNGPMGMIPGGSMGINPGGPMGMGPDGSMNMDQGGPMGTGPIGPMGMGSGGTMGMIPNVPMGMVPGSPIGMSPNGPMGTGPNIQIGMGPGGPMGMSPNGLTSPDGTIGMGANGETVPNGYRIEKGPGDPMDKGLTEIVLVSPNVPMGPNNQPVNYGSGGLPNYAMGNVPMNIGLSGPGESNGSGIGPGGLRGPGLGPRPGIGLEQRPNGAYFQPPSWPDGVIPPQSRPPRQSVPAPPSIKSIRNMKNMPKTPKPKNIPGIVLRTDETTQNPITDQMQTDNQTNGPEQIIDNTTPPTPGQENIMDPSQAPGSKPGPNPTSLQPGPEKNSPNTTETVSALPATTTMTKNPKPDFVPGPNEPFKMNFSDPNEPFINNYPDLIGHQETTSKILTSTTTTVAPEKAKADIQANITDKRPIHLDAIANMKLNLNGMLTEGVYQFSRIIVNKSNKDAEKIFYQFSRVVNWLRRKDKLRRFGEPADLAFRILLMEEFIEPTDFLQARAVKATHWMREERNKLGPDVNAILEFADRQYNSEEKEGVLDALEEINAYPDIKRDIYDIVFDLVDNLIMRPYGRMKGTIKELILCESVNRVLSMQMYGNLYAVRPPPPLQQRRAEGSKTRTNNNNGTKLDESDESMTQLRQLLVKYNQSAGMVNLTEHTRRNLYEISEFANGNYHNNYDSDKLVQDTRKERRQNYYPEYAEENTRNHKEDFGKQEKNYQINTKISYDEESALSGETVNPKYSKNIDKPIILPPKHQFRPTQVPDVLSGSIIDETTHRSRIKSTKQNTKHKSINIDKDYNFELEMENKIRKDADPFVKKINKMKHYKKHMIHPERAKLKNYPPGLENIDKEFNNQPWQSIVNNHQPMRQADKRLHDKNRQRKYLKMQNEIRQKLAVNTQNTNNFDYLDQYKGENNVDEHPWRENVNGVTPVHSYMDVKHKKHRTETKKQTNEKNISNASNIKNIVNPKEQSNFAKLDPNRYQSKDYIDINNQENTLITPEKSKTNAGKLNNIPQPSRNFRIPINKVPVQPADLNVLPEFQYSDNQIDYDMPMWTTEASPEEREFKGILKVKGHHKSKNRELTPLTDKQIQKNKNNVNPKSVTNNDKINKVQDTEVNGYDINIEKEIKKTLYKAKELHKQIKSAEAEAAEMKILSSASDESKSKHHKIKHKAPKHYKTKKRINKLKNKLSKEIKRNERHEKKLRHLKHDHPKIYQKYIKKHDIHDKRTYNHNHKYEKFLHDNIHHKKSKETGRAGHTNTKHKHRNKHHKHKNKHKHDKNKNENVFRTRFAEDSEYIEVFTGVSSETTSDSKESDQMTLPSTMMGPIESAVRETTKIKRYSVTPPATPHKLQLTVTRKNKHLREKHKYVLDVHDFRGEKVTPAKLNIKKRYSVVKRPKKDKGKGEDINKHRNKQQYLQIISRFKKVARNGTDSSDIRADSFSSVSSCSTDSDEMSVMESESNSESKNKQLRHFKGLAVPAPVLTVGIGTLPTLKILDKRARLLTTQKMKEFTNKKIVINTKKTNKIDHFKKNHMLKFKNVIDDKVTFRLRVDEDAEVSEDATTDFEIIPQTNVVKIDNEAYYAYDLYRRRANNKETNVTQNKYSRKFTVQVKSKEMQKLVKESHERKELAILAVAKERQKYSKANKTHIIRQTSSEIDEEPVLKDRIYKHLGYDSNPFNNTEAEVTLKSKRRMQHNENSLAQDVKKSPELMKAFDKKLSPKKKISIGEPSIEEDEEGLLRNNLNKLL